MKLSQIKEYLRSIDSSQLNEVVKLINYECLRRKPPSWAEILTDYARQNNGQIRLGEPEKKNEPEEGDIKGVKWFLVYTTSGSDDEVVVTKILDPKTPNLMALESLSEKMGQLFNIEKSHQTCGDYMDSNSLTHRTEICEACKRGVCWFNTHQKYEKI